MSAISSTCSVMASTYSESIMPLTCDDAVAL